jgi:hypothetical protein
MPLQDIGKVVRELKLGDVGPRAFQQFLAGLPGGAGAGTCQSPVRSLAEGNLGAVESKGVAQDGFIVEELEGLG